MTIIEKHKEQLIKHGSIVLKIKVKPNSSKTQFKGEMADGTLKVDVKARPEKGRANEELMAFLAREFGVSEERVEILRGKAERRKAVKIENIEFRIDEL